ncbi:MAG TPA: hypothetical protein DCM18_02400 [Ruminococcus sp.]|nr:hypothetical protein [Ruminococcus sp.]HBD71344.1 hypothetical protein [Ruminococcus sp.]HCW12386.1 hypothetical protein [Ruminococcus sp.]
MQKNPPFLLFQVKICGMIGAWMTVKQSAAQIHTFYIIKDFGTFCNAESSDFLSLWNKSYFLHKMCGLFLCILFLFPKFTTKGCLSL